MSDSELSRKFEKNQNSKKLKKSGTVFKQPLTIEQVESVVTVNPNTCHASAETLKLLDPKLTKAQMVLVQNSQICLHTKMTSRSFNSVPREIVASQPTQKLCVDQSFWPTPSVKWCKVLLVIADQYIKFIYCVPLKIKSAAGEAIEQIVLWVQNFCQKQVSLVHSDQGGEFMNGRLCKSSRAW